jgi:hypothetical protein
MMQMNHKLPTWTLNIIVYACIIGQTAFSQSKDLRAIDDNLTATYKSLVAADQDTRYDSIVPWFKQQLLEQLANPITFNHSLDSLAQYLTIQSSPDKRIKFYSWDSRSGGSWHTIYCFAQFRGKGRKIIVQQLTTEDEMADVDYTDTGIYQIHEIVISKTKYYLTFAWGTHGSGHQHRVVQIFSLFQDKLVKCTACFQEGTDLVVYYPRVHQANLTFDPATNVISFAEFIIQDDSGFHEPTGQTVQYKLTDGIFVKHLPEKNP